MTLFSEHASPHETFFVDIILPVPVGKRFTYRVPLVMNKYVKTGQRAIVQFGQKKILTGIIATLHQQPPKEYEAKYILELLDENEVVYPQQFKLYEWMANYYLCTQGEVLNAALPAGLKLSSESMVQLNPSFNYDDPSSGHFSDKEEILIRQLRKESLSYSDIVKLLGGKSIFTLLKTLTAKGVIILYEQVKEKFKPKTERHIRLADSFLDKKSLEKLFEEISSRPKQEAILLRYLQEVPVFSHPEHNSKGIARSRLLEVGLSESSLSTLVKHEVLEEFEVVVPRFGFADPETVHPLLLSENQEKARNEILDIFEKQGVALLQGVTGSGKTEIYVDLVRKALDGGSQVLLLLPEIALTTQIVQRLRKIFGTVMGVYHSRFSDNERVEVWNGVLMGNLRFVVGVRSSIFLPFDNLGLIIVDEEHDGSYKQHEPAPRYHARDVALIMARQHHAKVLLGSATPSLESYHHARKGTYGWVQLNERFGQAQLPDIQFADSLAGRKRKTIKGEFTFELMDAIRETIDAKEQVILFQNRRGYSPMVRCQDCGWIPQCINCAVSLTYHQYRHAMICHYCGYREEMPFSCPSCSSRRIETKGYGTEKLEEELKIYFPEATVQRMDLDTTRSKSGYEDIIEGFETGKTNILVGTQMVTKGLDFDKVSLVGVFDADRMMHFPDFRSYERAFQLITQVSGRSGRRGKKGKVIVQTTNTDHPMFQYVIGHDVTGFLDVQLEDRQLHFYPPYSRLILITVRHIDRQICQQVAISLSDLLQKKLPMIKVMGPAEPLIAKIRNEFRMTLLIKIARDQGNLAAIKSIITQMTNWVSDQKEFRSARIVLDVDPA